MCTYLSIFEVDWIYVCEMARTYLSIYGLDAALRRASILENVCTVSAFVAIAVVD